MRPRDDIKKMITVILDNSSPGVRKDLHCAKCGRIVANYYGDIRVIIMGEVLEVSHPYDVLCSRCGTMIRIA
jgi:hypothetical protein